MRTLWLLAFAALVPGVAIAQDADNDGLPDALEAQLGMDAHHADTFELLYDDKSREDGDRDIGRELEHAADFTKLWFCPAAHNRYVWKIDFTKPWTPRSDVALILYVDADNSRDTGRRDKEFARGVDMMLRPDAAQMFEWPQHVSSTAVAEGSALYLVADIDLNQQDGKSAYRCTLLIQNTAEGRQQDRDNCPFVDIVAAGRSDHPRPDVPPSHRLYHPPEVLSDVAVRIVPDAPEPTAEITWITSWPCTSRVEHGPTEDVREVAGAEPGMQNHRVFIPVPPDQTHHFRVICDSADGEQKRSDVLTLRTDPPPIKGTVDRGEIPLIITNAAGQALAGAPFITGVPFAPGTLGSVENVAIFQNGEERPTQTRCAARWPDGSVKWALVQFTADCPRESEAHVALHYGTAVRPTTTPTQIVTDEGNSLVCHTGPLHAVIDKHEFNLFRSLSFDRNGDGESSAEEELIGTQATGGLYLVDAEGKGYRSLEPEEITIEENGSVRAVVKVRGHHIAEDGSRLFEYIVRLVFYRGQSHVRIFHTFGNDNVGQTMTDIAQMGIRLPIDCGDHSRWSVIGQRATPDAGLEHYATAVAGQPARVEARQMHYEHCAITAGDGVDDEEATAVSAEMVTLRDEGLNLLCSVAGLRQQYPKGWLVEGNVLDIQLCPPLQGDEYADADPVTSDRLYYYVRDGVYRFHRGISKTHEIYLGLASGEDPPESFWALRRHDPLACRAPASWYAQTGAAGLMTPRTEGEFDEYEDFVERSFEAFQKRREQLGEYGMLNFGDWWGERGYNWGNIEYDTQHVMLMEYLRTGDPKLLRRGCEAAVHNRDVDGIHYAESPRDVGKVHVHCMFHTGGYEVRTPDKGLAMPRGGFNWGHVWTRGLFDHYFLTGDRRSLEWALTMSDYLAGPFTVNFSVGNHAERDTAWPIFGVMAAYEATADPYYLNAAKLMIEDVIRRQDTEAGNWQFPAGYSKVEPKPIGGYAWCCGLLISALDLYNHYADDPRVNEVITRAARWLVRDEWIAEKQGFRATSCPTFNASTPPGGACWSCANAMLIAHKLTGEQQFLDIARCGFSLFIRRTQAMGKGVTQSICLGPETLWRLKQAGITSLDPSSYLPEGEASIPRHLLIWPDARALLPVVLRSSRDEKLRAGARVTAPEGLHCEPPAHETELTANGQEARFAFELRGSDALKPGESRDLQVHWTLGSRVGEQAVKLIRPDPISTGNKVGLIASGDDFLGPALDALGVSYERPVSLDDIGDFKAILLGTQAHSINSLDLRDRYWKLFPWLRAGGTLLCSQLNDTGWNRFFLPYEVVVDELDGESGDIASPEHAILDCPHKIATAAGVKMYDTLHLLPDAPWTVIIHDATGGPAVAESKYGRGRIILMQPSFERVAAGTERAPTDAQARALFENIITYVTR